MKTIVSERITSHFAIVNAIDTAIKEFLNDENLYFIKVKLKWLNFEGKREGEVVIFRREVINQYFGLDYFKYLKSGGKKLKLETKSDYIRLYDYLRKTQPKI